VTTDGTAATAAESAAATAAESAAATGNAEQSSAPSAASGSRKVAAGILASRGVGLVREMVVAAALGRGAFADAFRVAMRVPNLLQNLLGEGSISAAFVPVYARLIEDGRDDDAHRLARQTLGVLSAVVSILVALILLGARPMVWFTTLGRISGERFELAVSLTRFTALGVGFLVLSAFCLGILNAHRRYLLSYAAPVLWSLAQIVGFAAALVFSRSPADIARWGAIAMVVGSLGQLVVQLPTVKAVGGLGRPSLTVGPELREVLTRFVPAVGGRGVVQLSSYVDLALASFLAAGAIATIGYAMPLYLLSIAVFGFSVAVSELTEMSRSTAGLDAVAARVRAAQRRVLLPAGVVTAGAIGAGGIVVGSLYEFINDLARRLFDVGAGTAFGADDTTAVALTLAAFALGLPAAMVARVSQNALYALGDVKGPARIALVRLGVGAVLGFLLMLQFDRLVVGEVPIALTVEQVTDAVSALGVGVGGSGLGLTTIDGFPHAAFWEPLPNREAITFAEAAAGEKGTAFVHLGAVGLGLGSAVASWTEWFLLRRRLRDKLGESVSTGIGLWVAIGGFAAFVAARAVVSIGLPPVVNLVIVGAVVLCTYVGSLQFIGLIGNQPVGRSARGSLGK